MILTWIDLVVLGIIALSMLISLFRGLIKEVMGLAIWIAAFWVAYFFTDEVSVLFETGVPLPSARMAIAFALLFVITLILGAIVNSLLGKLIETTGLTGTDRFLGMFFGFARAMVLLLAMVMLAGMTPLPRDNWWQESALLPHLQRWSAWAGSYLPQSVRAQIDYQGTDQTSP